VKNFHECSDDLRKRMWINGYQIGQINALQRQRPFSMLENDSTSLSFLTFSEQFGSPIQTDLSGKMDSSRIWVGGDDLRNLLETADLPHEVTFYDFSHHALTPLIRPNLIHFPCLAVDGMVIAMSMEHPPKPDAGSEYQPGNKAHSWGKLLSGWSILPSGNHVSRAYGPAAPEEGLILPAGCVLDGEGFLMEA
jgi:acyl-[acyl-carrier-protein]-phospholipid O-acyltransferase / long-chain-fatty-acid--[acyl-carrier-protein] ligase